MAGICLISLWLYLFVNIVCALHVDVTLFVLICYIFGFFSTSPIAGSRSGRRGVGGDLLCLSLYFQRH